jgi:hypothetical protein
MSASQRYREHCAASLFGMVRRENAYSNMQEL